jgi:transaldolase
VFFFPTNFTATTGEKLPKVSYVNDEAAFRWALFSEEMAWDKLHEGIRKFAEDAETLKAMLKEKLQK